MNEIGQFFTAHLTQGLTNTSSSAYRDDPRLRGFCQRLKSVSNSGIKYDELVLNNVRRAIKGDLYNISDMENRISVCEDKIIMRIAAINSQRETRAGVLVAELRIRKNIGHLEKRIAKACEKVRDLNPPSRQRVPYYAMSGLTHFMKEKNNLAHFVNGALYSAPPCYEPPSPYDVAVKK